MNNLLVFFAALALSMAIIPLMIRLAPRLGMVDTPNQRKVHTRPIPRVGGIGLVFGALIPLLLWIPLDDATLAYVFGAMVLFGFGVWDDSHELGHYIKFIGQFIAVLSVVYYGDVYVEAFPFMDEPLPEFIGKPFTVFAMVGMINAINHSDGLDGLAGGISVLSLSCIAYFAFLADGHQIVTIAVAVLGGILGFMRYNTHPARVFMGDSGSQFLGFTLGFLSVFLVSKVNPAISPAAVALILGLPIVDILAVFAQRIYHGMNWFQASKNHIHHRLLQLGFDHYEAVVFIYSIQILFIVSALFLLYESDVLILIIYGIVCSLIFLFLMTAEHKRWRAHSSNRLSRLAVTIGKIKQNKIFVSMPVWYIATTIPLIFILVSLWVDYVPRDFGSTSAALGVILFIVIVILKKNSNLMITQGISYITAAFVVYLETKYLGQRSPLMAGVELAYFVSLAIAISIVIRYDDKKNFRTTPMDFLVVVTVLFAGYLLNNLPEKTHLGSMAVKLVILFYGCELLFTHMKKRWHVLNITSVTTLTILAARGLIL